MITNIQKLGVTSEIIIRLNYNFEFERKLKVKCDESLNYSNDHSDKVLLESGDAVSTVMHNINGQPHTWVENKRFVEFLNANLPNIQKEFKLINNSLTIANSWMNRHSMGGETLEHSHPGIDLVVSSYLYCPPNSGNLVIRDPLEYHRWSSYHDASLHKDHAYPWIEIPVKTNDVLIFPGWLVHKTEKNSTNIDRYVMTTNLKFGLNNPMMTLSMT
jgi:uncharacterized protein (TIGR02466 family)